ncbi:hypothetical protein [Psychroserpens sp.]|uniref:hypothetical protein n=1 Tax=Psychroserpens sp. TaxID=2020870 RepID=UPI00385EA14D
MKTTFNFYSFILTLIVSIYSQSIISQTHVLRTSFPKDMDEFIINSKTLKNIEDKQKSRKYIYITDNECYVTFVPNFKNDALQYEFSNFPTFTYLKVFDIFIVKKLGRKDILSHEKFTKLFTYKPTKKFKNYFGINAEIYASDNNFYECEFLVADGESNLDTQPFLKILKDLKLLSLKPNQKVVAINYLGIEFDIDYVTLKREYGKNINEEVYSDDTVDEETLKEDFKEIYNTQELEHLINKDYTFDTKKHIIFTDHHRSQSVDTLNIYDDSKTGNSINFYKDFFTLNLKTHFIRGKLNEDGSLKPENFYALLDSTKANSTDFTKYKVISKKISENQVELILQGDKGFWSFFKYIISTEPRENEDISTFKLPNNVTVKGYLKNFHTFTASYGRIEYERSTKQGDKTPIKQAKTFFLHE